MAKKLAVINQLRPRISNQGIMDLEKAAGRASKNTILLPCFNPGKEFKKVLDTLDFEKA
ncbi:MAG: hypothetical protein ACOYYJ_22605 [Chloroflexota bacterium]